jgi:hypothetical protein
MLTRQLGISRHAGRLTINADDVKVSPGLTDTDLASHADSESGLQLAARRNEPMVR